MTEFLKKYLFDKWWIPILFFIASLFVFFKFDIIPNTDFSLYLLGFSIILLYAASFWQFFKGSKIIGLLQFSIVSTVIMIIVVLAYFLAALFYKPDEKLATENIKPLIEEKTDLIIPENFEVLDNLIEHTEGAFDSDYSILLKVKYLEDDEKSITEQISNTLHLKSEKGIWKRSENGYSFEHNNTEENMAEPFYFKIDTLNNFIELNLTHL